MKTKNFLIILFISFIAISCNDENMAPTCQIISPTDGDIFYVGDKVSVNISALDPDGNINELQLFVNGVGISSISEFPYNFDWETADEEEGDYKISVIVFDNKGVQTEASINVKLEKLHTGVFFDDRDGKAYKWVEIGDQVWMVENLAYLPQVDTLDDESQISPRYYVYGYNGIDIDSAKISENYNDLGVLYNWPAALTACPEGWHLPSNNEWAKLAEYIGKNFNEYDNSTNTWFNVGLHLKSQTGWENNGNGTDDYEFNGKPGGYYDSNSKLFKSINKTGYWWSRSEFGSNNSWKWILEGDHSEFLHSYQQRSYGFSIRCIKD